MDCTLDEQALLARFRQLHPDGKKELLDYAAFLVKKYHSDAAATPQHPGNQCPLEQPEKRPEAAKEPIFTE